ncbi:hypothetical protein [Nonomuraea maheshkhaliensis]|uniref:hypothetical protein n=1 Tax=Nonomuraea maheshkhaliensis TaxID=419590 RepID=UPI0031F8D4BF
MADPGPVLRREPARCLPADLSTLRDGADRPEELVSARWGFRADRAATPAVLAWGDRGGAALIANERSSLGPTGLAIDHTEGALGSTGSAIGHAESASSLDGPTIDHAAGTATISLLFPYQEYPVTYYGSALARPAEAAVHVRRPGESHVLTVATCALPADRHAYAPLLREDRELRLSAAPVEPWADVAEAADIAAEGLYRWHCDPEPGVLLETVGSDREISGGDGERVDRQAMHVGWVSGIPWATALLEHGLRTGWCAPPSRSSCRGRSETRTTPSGPTRRSPASASFCPPPTATSTPPAA